MIRTTLLFSLLVAVWATGYAAGINSMYPDGELAKDKGRYERRVTELFSAGLWEFMSGAEKRALSGARIELPLKGKCPLDAYAYKRAKVPIVVFPVLSLKFIEDLSMAYAWRHVNQHSLQPVDEYLAMLKYRRAEEFPNGRIPDPLIALGVPPRIWERDKRVDELSLRFRNTAWAFVLAHELGHLRFQHPGNRQVPPAVSQRNEAEADAFAVVLLSRSDTIPMGMMLWFQASVGYFKNQADFRTGEAYRKWMQAESTHPVNPERLRRMAALLNRTAEATLSRNHAEVLRFIAGKLMGMGDILAEPDMQRLIARCAVLRRPDELKRLEDRACNK